MAGGLVHAPRTEVAVDRDPRDQIAVRLDHSGDARFARAPLGGPQPQWLLGHAAVAGDLDAAVEHRLRVLGHARHVLVVGMQPQLTPGAGDDRGGLSVVVGVGVRAHDQAHLLEAQVAHVERPFQLRERVGLMHARVEQHHAVAGPDGPRVAVGHARPGKRQAQAVHAREHALAPAELAPPLRPARRRAARSVARMRHAAQTRLRLSGGVRKESA